MKRIISLFLILCLSVFALCGCGDDTSTSKTKPEAEPGEEPVIEEVASPEEIIDDVIANFQAVESMRAEMVTDSDISVQGISTYSKATAIIEMNNKDNIQYLKLSMDAAGQETNSEAYVKINSDNADAYVMTDGKWIKQTGIPSNKLSELGLTTNAHTLLTFYLEAIKEDCDFNEENIDGTDCYVFSGKIDAGKEDLLNKVGLGTLIKTLAQSGIPSATIDEIISNAGTFDVIIYVDKTTLLPIQADFDVTDVTANIMSGLAEAIGQPDIIIVKKNSGVTKYDKFDKIGKIVIPDEALSGEEVNIY